VGSPRAVTSSTGMVLWQWTYAGSPFGEKTPASSNGYTLNLRFPGQYFDAESGLNFNAHRDFETAAGRYQQSDPLGVDAGGSTYGYVAGNPLSFSDQQGLACDQEVRCYEEYEEDSDVCRSLPNVTSRDKEVRQACWASAADRLAACNAKRLIPRLVTWLSEPYSERSPKPEKAPAPRGTVYVPPAIPLSPPVTATQFELVSVW